MNLIDAWKQAKKGQKIQRKSRPDSVSYIKGEPNRGNIKYIMHNTTETYILADDWEIVKKSNLNISISDGFVEYQYPLDLDETYSITSIYKNICDKFNLSPKEGKKRS